MNYWRVKVGEAIIHLPEVNCYLRLSCLYFDSALSFMWTPECLDLSSVCFCNTRQKKPTLFFSSSSALPLLVIWTLLLLFLCVTLEHLCFNPTAYQFASVAAERWASAAPVYVCRSAAVREHRRTKEETACRSWRGEEGWRGPERSEKRSWVANWRHWWDFALCLIFEKVSMQLRSCRVFGTEVRCLCWTSDHLWPFHQCPLHLWRCFKVLSQTLKMDIHNKVEISNGII